MARKILARVPAAEGLKFYRRAGLCLTRGADNIVEVTDEQLKVLRADPLVAVGDPPPEQPKQQEQPKK